MVPGVRVVLLAISLTSLAPLLAGARAGGSHDIDVQIQLGDLLYAGGRYRESLEAYQRADALADGPSKTRAKMGVIRSALRLAEFDLATEHARLLQKLAPDDEDATAVRGDAAWAAGHFDEAEAMARAVLDHVPDHARARLGLARSLAGRNQLQAAFDEAQVALAAAPSDPEVHFLLGTLNQRLRRVPEAIASYTNYINLLPNKDHGTMSVWAQSEIRLLQSYGNRVPLEIDPAAAGKVHEIPFRLDRGKVIVPGRANGRPVQFTVDTGAEHTVLTVKTAERVGIRPIVTTLSAGVGEVGLRGLQVGRLDSLEIGTFKVRNVRCMVKNPPLTGLPTSETEAFSPLALGLSAELDYAARTLKIGESIPVAPADVELPLRVNRLATVRGIVND
ncbi:MAG: tetratricopeptide repeat protein, partial [Acidobacteria bacterium]